MAPITLLVQIEAFEGMSALWDLKKKKLYFMRRSMYRWKMETRTDKILFTIADRSSEYKCKPY
jgi:hypothetical protein